MRRWFKWKCEGISEAFEEIDAVPGAFRDIFTLCEPNLWILLAFLIMMNELESLHMQASEVRLSVPPSTPAESPLSASAESNHVITEPIFPVSSSARLICWSHQSPNNNRALDKKLILFVHNMQWISIASGRGKKLSVWPKQWGSVLTLASYYLLGIMLLCFAMLLCFVCDFFYVSQAHGANVILKFSP